MDLAFPYAASHVKRPPQVYQTSLPLFVIVIVIVLVLDLDPDIDFLLPLGRRSGGGGGGLLLDGLGPTSRGVFREA